MSTKTIGNDESQPNSFSCDFNDGVYGDGTQRIVLASNDPLRTSFHRWVKGDLVTQAGAIAALDQLCDEFAFTGMSLIDNGGGEFQGMLLQCNNLTIIAAELWLYAVNPTAAGTNNPHDQSDANAEASSPFAIVEFNAWRATASNMECVGTYAGIPVSVRNPVGFTCLDSTDKKNVWGIMMTRTAVTPGATTDYNLFYDPRPGA